MSKIFLFLSLLAPSVGFAHGSSIQMVSDSTTEALQKFESEEVSAATSFSGVKTWISGADAKVRVYYNNNADSIYYTCVMHHGDNGEEHLNCSKD